jgi:hypothetical protein
LPAPKTAPRRKRANSPSAPSAMRTIS